MFYQTIILVLSTLPLVHADGWDDFSNNLATDLAPILSLFGEQVTKQYLSESITMLDYFIFAMAPMGIITAIVSVIRVCGSPSLRAFIGRAQEGGGNAEAELCSSTSRDVCELYNNGGIARVFGRPKILEIVYDPRHLGGGKREAGIFTFREYIKTEAGKEEWNWAPSMPNVEEAIEPFAPNLSLNVGIKRQPKAIFWAVSILGLLSQASVLVFAALATYYLRWEKDGRRPDSYSCPLAIVGTILVGGGSFLCAFLVGQSTKEQVFRRFKDPKKKADHVSSSIYWIQPGNQILGDQIFDAFCYSDADDPLLEYISSFKDRSRTPGIMVWTAVCTTITGFVLQFIGLRGLHSAVSVAQLGAILVMSLARSALRMQRLKTEDNLLALCPDEVSGHELDWLALHIGSRSASKDMSPEVPHTSHKLPRCLWRVSGLPKTGKGLEPNPPSTDNFSFVSTLLEIRTRLAELTQSVTTRSGKSANFDMRMVEVREEAERLSMAIEATVNTIFKDDGANIRPEWKDALHMQWGVACYTCLVQNGHDLPSDNDKQYDTIHIYLKRQSLGGLWRLERRPEIESILGLWLWSLKSDPVVETLDSQKFTISMAQEISTRRIFSTNKRFTEAELRMWLNDDLPDAVEKDLGLDGGLVDCADPSSIWQWSGSKSIGGVVASSATLAATPSSAFVRLYGWPVDKAQFSNKSSVWTLPARGSLLRLCSQEILTLFATSALEIVDKFGDVKICQSFDNIYLENTLISDMAKPFTEYQLGTTPEAMLCILPQIMLTLQPPLKSPLKVIMDTATQYRRTQQWIQADVLLRWAWTICTESRAPEETVEEVTISLCILYWWAIIDKKGSKLGGSFSQNGIDRLASYKTKSSESDRVQDLIHRYEVVLKKMEIDDGRPNRKSLLAAIKDGNITQVLLFLSRSTSPTERDIRSAALPYAMQRNWTDIVLILLELGCDSDHPTQESWNPLTALHYAAYLNNSVCGKELLDRGASPTSEDNRKQTPLIYAAIWGSSEIVKLLLSHSLVNPDIQDENGRSALSYAAEKGHVEIVDLLLRSKQTSVDLRDNDGRTPLFWAIQSWNSNEEVIKLLIETGSCDLELRDNCGLTPLLKAAYDGHTQFVKVLIDLGGAKTTTTITDTKTVTPSKITTTSDTTATTSNTTTTTSDTTTDTSDTTTTTSSVSVGILSAGLTPLHLASMCGHEDTMKLLLKYEEVDPDIRDEKARTPLLIAAAFGCGKAVKTLVDTGKVEIDTIDRSGRTPFSYIVQHGRHEIARFLRSAGEVDMDLRDTIGRTPLSWAAGSSYSNEQTLKLLFDAQVDVDSKDNNGRTPLSWAADSSYISERIVKLLLNTGRVDADSRDNDGRTPLSWAAGSFHSNEKIIKLLLWTGNVDAFSEDNNGRTPLFYAEKNTNREKRLRVVKFLQNYMKNMKEKEKSVPAIFDSQN